MMKADAKLRVLLYAVDKSLIGLLVIATDVVVEFGASKMQSTPVPDASQLE